MALPVKLDKAEPTVGRAWELVNNELKLKLPVGEGG